MIEGLIEDLGYGKLGEQVVKPREGVRFAGYVDRRTNRPSVQSAADKR